MTHSRIQLTLLSVFSIFKAKKAIFKEESTLSMGPILSKNILEIQQIESGTLAKFWSDGRNVAKVIANFVQPFCQKQALPWAHLAQTSSDKLDIIVWWSVIPNMIKS